MRGSGSPVTTVLGTCNSASKCCSSCSHSAAVHMQINAQPLPIQQQAQHKAPAACERMLHAHDLTCSVSAAALIDGHIGTALWQAGKQLCGSRASLLCRLLAMNSRVPAGTGGRLESSRQGTPLLAAACSMSRNSCRAAARALHEALSQQLLPRSSLRGRRAPSPPALMNSDLCVLWDDLHATPLGVLLCQSSMQCCTGLLWGQGAQSRQQFNNWRLQFCEYAAVQKDQCAAAEAETSDDGKPALPESAVSRHSACAWAR